ncbi:MAG: ribosome maturation factor RimM [Flavobacteriales bacterium]|jgi:16S rRNA processing protein RimM|nr:ribosome maturation factor RimM [Flavobacteriales bacterium]
MLQHQDCFSLGKVLRKHGYKGDFIVRFDADDIHRYEGIDVALFDFKGELVPLPLTKCQFLKNDTFLMHIEGFDHEEDLYKVLRSEIFLPLDLLPDLADEEFYYHEIENYEVQDENLGNIGKVAFVRQDTAQDILYVKKDEKEILIPLVDGIYQKVDKKNKIIFVNTPSGLVDLYLEED